VVKAKNLF